MPEATAPKPEDDAQADPAGTLAKFRSHMIAREEQFRRVDDERRADRRQAEVRADHAVALLRAERDLRIEAEARVDHTLALLHAERDLRVEAEARADHSLALFGAEHASRIGAEAALAAVVTSTSWRATNRLRALVTKTPRLRRALRAVAHALARLLPAAR